MSAFIFFRRRTSCSHRLDSGSGSWAQWPVPQAFAQSTAFTPDDLVRLKRVSDPQVSPDGHYVAYVVAETDLAEDKRRTDLWLIDLTAKTPLPRRLTQNPANDTTPRWSADSKFIYFLSTRSGLFAGVAPAARRR